MTVSSQSAAREAFSIDFAREVRAKYPDIPLMLTGGFRTREGMKAALESGACDLIGLGRPAVVTPDLPEKIILNEKIPDEDAKLPMKAVKSWWFSDFLLWFGIRIISGANVTVSIMKILSFRRF